MPTKTFYVTRDEAYGGHAFVHLRSLGYGPKRGKIMHGLWYSEFMRIYGLILKPGETKRVRLEEVKL